MKHIAFAPLLAVALFVFSSAAFADDTSDRYSSPSAAARATLSDVLQNQPTPATTVKRQSTSPSGLHVPSTVSPALAPPSTSSANVMMMQGMQEGLQQVDSGTAPLPQQVLTVPKVQPSSPQLQPAVPSLTPMAPQPLSPVYQARGAYPVLTTPTAASVAVPSYTSNIATTPLPPAPTIATGAPVSIVAPPEPATPGVTYQPGQAPQNLVGEIAKVEPVTSIPASSSYVVTPVPAPAGAMPAASSAPASTLPRASWQPPLPPIATTSVQPLPASSLTPTATATIAAWPPVPPPAQGTTEVTTTTTTTSVPVVPASQSGSWSANGVAAITADCVPHVESWTKTCDEAGYPSGYVGKVTGETRTICPDGTTQDVWIGNSCAQPGSAETNTAPPQSAVSAPQTAPLVTPAAAPQQPILVTAPPPPPAMSASEGNIAPVSEPAPTIVSAPEPAPMAAPVIVSPPPPPALSASESGATTVISAPPVMPPSRTMAMPVTRADASCGTANGLTTTVKPVAELCSSGMATEVTGSGPWRWNCRGSDGGMSVSCAAPIAEMAPAIPAVAPVPAAAAPVVEDAMCGSSNGMGTDHAPTGNLCARGIASRVSGNGPWSWACSGTNGGQAVVCGAQKKVDGTCGGAARNGSDQMPATDLCVTGIASAVTGEGPWTWTCSGMNGGAASTCSASAKSNAVCGSATLMGRRDAPLDGLCSVGAPSSVHGNGPWTWSCGGSNGGSSVACTALVSIDGRCGMANGVAMTHAPKDHLCTQGVPSRVNGTGPWAWNCTGKDGGDSESCTAPVATPSPAVAMPASPVAPIPSAPVAPPPAMPASEAPSLCGSASDLMALEAPNKNLCAKGSASDVAGTGPWTWTCSDDAGHTSSCSTLTPEGSLKATAPAAISAPMPSSSMMAPPPAAPFATGSSLNAPGNAAPAEEVASCGIAGGQGSVHVPHDGLCSSGKPSTVRGSGPWHWVCVKGKSTVACEAPALVDAACGLANGSVQKAIPQTDLCRAGTPTDVHGNGPWLWSCVGSGGGASISCSATSQAQTRVDGACGAASNVAVTATPDTNLCDSGIPSMVYGDGPWTWTCSGLNGGVATSCSTQRNVPAAPAPPGPAVNGLCGSANGVALTVQPMDDLCTTGTPTAVSGDGPWNWNCLGTNGGMTVSCTSPLQPPSPITGVCGAASGVPTLTMPRSGLCSAGISSAVSGKGPWTWSCSGTNGGGAVACVAPLAGTDVGSLPSLVTTPPAGEAPPPMAAPQTPVSTGGLVTPHLPSGPLPPLETGSMPPEPTPTNPPALPPSLGGQSSVPEEEPQLPNGTTPLNPPPIRDTLAPSPALKPPAIDSEGNAIPGNHFKLPDDVTTLPFKHADENIDPNSVATLDKLANVLENNTGVRVTLTAYAEGDTGMSPREARRLSLSRALAVRDYLTSKGISSSRIDVRALGANVPSGQPDRVDIKAN